MNTGRKIMNLRLDLEINQRDLAHACGVTPGALSKIETGANRPSSLVLKRIAAELDTTADYLLDDAAPYPPPRPAQERGRTTARERAERVSARVAREELWLLEDLNRLGAWWREAALAIPGARPETIRLVRYLLQRDQLAGPRAAEDAARKLGRRKR
jgi:transcriptional regulator with XRE-family HTH domain